MPVMRGHEPEDRIEGPTESEERYRVLSDAAREAVMIHEDGIIREINRAFTAVLGYERTEVIGHPGLTWVVPESADRVIGRMRGAVSGYAGLAVVVCKNDGLPSASRTRAPGSDALCPESVIRDKSKKGVLSQYQAKSPEFLRSRPNGAAGISERFLDSGH